MSENNNVNKQNFFKVHKAEFKKITWPTRDVLIKQTINVIIISIIVGIIIFGYDILINYLRDLVVKVMA